MMKKIMFIILTIFLLTGCKEKIYEDLTDENIILQNNILEVYSDYNLSDIIQYKNNEMEVLTKDFKIDTTKLGTQNHKIYFKKDKKKYVYNFNVQIVDTEEPRVISGTNKTILLNYSNDLCDLIMYGDNYSGYVTCDIEGDYDLSSVGTYNLIYKLADSSNNVKEVNVTLNVKEKTGNSSTQSSSKKQFSEVYNTYKNDNNELGIDVSKWQGNIDFNKVKEAGATFVMMRIGVQTARNGEIGVDSYFLENIKKAKEAGLKVGVYLYTKAGNIEEVRKHALWVINTLNKETLDLPVAFDWENFGSWNSFRISFYEVNEMVNTFIEILNEHGYEGMLYSSKNYLEKIWENKKDYPVWLAHYTSQTNYEGKYIMWQMCNTGRIDGINGDVDIDILYH